MAADVIDIEHYSDILCIWAFIAQRRVEQLQRDFPDSVRVDHRFLQVFGDVRGKLETQWSDRGGLAGYAAHVQEVAGGFDHVRIHPDAWLANAPTSSLPAHLLLCAVKTLREQEPGHCDAEVLPRLMTAMRQAFFLELEDISDHATLLGIAERSGVNLASLERSLRSGSAHARLAADLASANQAMVRASPTLRFNEGRQLLTGNVGYRVIEANVRELLRNPRDQQSWC